MSQGPTFWERIREFFGGDSQISTNSIYLLPLLVVFAVGLVLSIKAKGGIPSARRKWAIVGCIIGLLGCVINFLLPFIIERVLGATETGEIFDLLAGFQIVTVGIHTFAVLFLVLAAVSRSSEKSSDGQLPEPLVAEGGVGD